MHMFDNCGYERNDPAPIKVIVTAADTTPPTFSAFDVNPKNITSEESGAMKYWSSDRGSGLRQDDLWRAPDNGGGAGTWPKTTTNVHSGSRPPTLLNGSD